MYNKKYFLKRNNKKILHKAKKHWVVVTLSLLLAISGASIYHINIKANSLYNNQSNVTSSNSFIKLKSNKVNNISYIQPNLDPIYNQNIHFNVPKGELGDIEDISPKYVNNKVISYNIYSMYGPDGNNLQWGKFNTTDFSKFTPSNNYDVNNNIVLPDGNADIANDNTNGTPWNSSASGSIISNNGKLSHDKWGNSILPNAKLAYFLSMNDNNVWLAYSNNNKQFHPYNEQPVIRQSNYNINGDFIRDPFVMQNPIHRNEWDAYLGGGDNSKVYVFTSTDGLNWHYNSSNDIPLSNSGCVEMPIIKMLDNKPVLFTSCEPGQGRTYYTLGNFNDNGIFIPDSNVINALDNGTDNYAANYVSIDPNTIVQVSKLQNWSYNPNGNNHHRGSFTLPRVIQFNRNHMNITPIDPGIKTINSSQIANNLTIDPNKEISLRFNKPISNFNIEFKRDDSDNISVIFEFNNGNLIISRYDSNLNKLQSMNRLSNLGVNSLSGINFYLDNDSIEAYVPESHKIFTWADYTSTRNAKYQMTTNVPVQANVYGFNLGQAPQLNNVNNITSKYSIDKANLNKDMSVLNNHTSDSVNNYKTLLTSYFNDIQNDINDANDNITQVNNYNGDARRHVFIALANNDMNMANTKLYQVSLQLKKLDDMAMPYLSASVADARIANYYKNSISNSVASANQNKANSAASSANASIESSIANSYAQSANSSIASSYRNSIAKSVSSANHSKADSAASSADASIESSIASSYAQSADQSIARSEASKSANHQAPTPAPQPNVPTMPTNNVIPTVPTNPISNEPSMASSSAYVANSNASEINSSASSVSNTNSRINSLRSKITIPLVGLAKHSHFYSNKNKRFVLTNRMKKHADVLQATINPNHKIIYKVRIGKRTGYLYGYLRKLFKPTFMNKRYSYVHVGNHTIKLSAKRFNRIKVNHAVRYAGKNYVKYYVSYRHKHGVIYGALPKFAKVSPSKNVYKKYYQVIPKRYHYVKVIKPLVVYDNKRFTRRTHRGSIRKGITVRVKRLVKNGGITRFKLMNGRYITGLKKYVKLIK